MDDESHGDPLRLLFRRRRDAVLTLIVFAVAVQLLLFPVAWGGRTMVSAPFYNVQRDPGAETSGVGYLIDPWAGFLIEGPGLWLTHEALSRGEVPLWNPYEACGAPYLANAETAPLSVVQLPLHLAPSVRAWDLFALCRMAVAAWLASLLALSLGRGRAATVLAGAVFGFGGGFALHANLVHLNAAMWTPLLFLMVEAWLARRGAGRFAALTVVIALALNGGNPQPAVVALLAAGVRTLIAPPPGVGPRLAAAAGVVGAALLGAAATAPALWPLAELLRDSVNRTQFTLDTTAGWSSVLTWSAPAVADVAGAGGPAGSPAWWYVGGIAATAGAAGLVLSLLGRTGLARWAVPLVLLLAIQYVAPLGRLFASELPVLSGVNWPKYVTTTQLLIGLMAAATLDGLGERRVRRAVVAVGTLHVALWLAVALSAKLSSTAAVHVLGGVAVLVLAAWLSSRRRALAAGAVALLTLVELGLLRPSYPARGPEPFSKPPAVVTKLDELHARDIEETGQPWRTMAFGDTFPPLTSGCLGWYDVRSVSPLPFDRYHRWLAPYANCGVWPPYLLLGASREILLSPCLDLAGVRWVIIKDHRQVTGHAGNVLEPVPPIRFGEVQRAMIPETIEVSGLSQIFAERATCRLEHGGRVRFDAALRAKRARIGLRSRSPDGTPFALAVAIGDDARTIRDDAEQTWTIEGYVPRVPFEIRVEEGGPIELTFTEWWVDRHLTKDQLGYELDLTRVDFEAGVTALLNKDALPIARMAPRVRHVTAGDFDRLWDRFVATGDGWDWRDEVVLIDVPPEERVAPDACPEGGEVELRYEGFNRMRVEVDAKAPGWLHLAVTHDGNWNARLDGDAVPVYVANGPFMAVPLAAAGRHVIELDYRPPAFEAGVRLAVGSWIALLLLAVAAGLRARRDRRRRHAPTAAAE